MNRFKTWLKFRIFIAMLLFFVAFSIVFIRAFQFQVVDSPKFKAIALKQRLKEETLLPRRGTIYDRNMKDMAVSMDAASIYVQPQHIENRGDVVKALAPVTAMNKSEIIEKINRDKPFVWIKRKVDFQKISERKELKIKGVGILTEDKRVYPNFRLASDIIGFTGLDSNGLEGIEFKFDAYLQGSGRVIIDEKDANGDAITLNNNVDRVRISRGMDIVLTIDKTVQYITEKELGKAVASTGAKGGTAMVMDPKTGEVLAMADLPSFDPNTFLQYRAHLWKNRLVSDAFEPGSTFKTFLIAAAFEEGVAKQTDIFFCENGEYKVFDRVIHDAHDRKFGWLSVTDIIRHSSNIGAAKIGEKLGKEAFYRYIKGFGFGSKANIDLPGEIAGSVQHPKRWSGVSIDTISFGQGISITGIQLAAAFSSIANGGYLMKPIIVKRIIDSEGKIVKEFTPEIQRRVISEDTAKKVTEVLKTVTNTGGSGIKAQVDGFEVAGKTGTAQKANLLTGGYLEDRYMSSFIGFVPADNPGIVILIILDEPRGVFYGGQVAAPVFREISKQVLPYLGIYTNDGKAERYVSDSFVSTSNKRFFEDSSAAFDSYSDEGNYAMPDLKDKTIRQVLKILREIPMEVKVVGSGRAFYQSPMPGANLSPGVVCEVRFQ
ncbi:MAG: PASTA domain-containing protein [Deltaproteobacteria bacterium]|nr:PASTA domain-containing protein [Deltaproteobacteria bacterium]